ncbi:hypothetical protein MKEN_01198100 [Mycena kentingensis (nom. inval.)]|nr:hypothetical protein MKEN_01198100 [Mycena kentingensis (nom. inval.)]
MFVLGDALGNLKSLQISPDSPFHLSDLHSHSAKSSVAAISIHSQNLAAAYADGSLASYTWNEDKLEPTATWKETRLKSQDSFVGLSKTEKGVFSCASNGALRLVKSGDSDPEHVLASLPTRLSAWKLSTDCTTFSYGGNEVDVSLWNTESAFSSNTAASSSSAKRKRDDLFPGEVWRAKNLPNDHLGLRQPIRITALTYLPSSSSSPQLLSGTQLGEVRRYDTRARRPASNWQDLAKTGGVKVLEKGVADHEIFVGDHGCRLSSVDLRNGRIVHSYKGLAGAATSVAPSSIPAADGRGGTIVVSTALDRYCRIHTTFPPPATTGQNQENKGSVVEKIFNASVPTAVVWDGVRPAIPVKPDADAADEIWDEMENVADSDEEPEGRSKRPRK